MPFAPHKLDLSRLSVLERLRDNARGVARKARDSAQQMHDECMLLNRQLADLARRHPMDLSSANEKRAEILRLTAKRDELVKQHAELRGRAEAEGERQTAATRLYEAAEQFSKA